MYRSVRKKLSTAEYLQNYPSGIFHCAGSSRYRYSRKEHIFFSNRNRISHPPDTKNPRNITIPAGTRLEEKELDLNQFEYFCSWNKTPRKDKFNTYLETIQQIYPNFVTVYLKQLAEELPNEILARTKQAKQNHMQIKTFIEESYAKYKVALERELNKVEADKQKELNKVKTEPEYDESKIEL